MTRPTDQQLQAIYGEDLAEARARYENLCAGFAKRFGEADGTRFFSAPGRTEIIGNHTDHNGGRILAASITKDTICAAAPNGTDVIRLYSEGYDKECEIAIDRRAEWQHKSGTEALIAGMADGALARGFRIGGFNAYVSTQVISAAGVSSSASFEMTFLAAVNTLFNDGKMTVEDYARIGQHAENAYWDKASGLMDQLACAHGGTILVDCGGGALCTPVEFSYDMLGCDLVIVGTGKAHGDLSAEYSSVPQEMKQVAVALGKETLHETNAEALFRKWGEIRASIGNDRALLRALHYFEECDRVDAAYEALQAGKAEEMLAFINASGDSSFELLQNVYVSGETDKQAVALAIALSKRFLRTIDAPGATRVHGGGFAGVIMCAVPKTSTKDYIAFMSRFFEEKEMYVMNIRAKGAVCVDLRS